MIVNMSTTSLALVLVMGDATASGSNLRRRATLFGHGHDGKNAASTNKKHHARSPAASGDAASAASTSSVASASDSNSNDAVAGEEESIAVEEMAVAATATPTDVESSMTLDKSTYDESESIIVSFSVGSPSHPQYSSSDIDYNYPEWSVGLFMRDADPQGGTLSPIVSVNLCGAMGDHCDADDCDFASYNGLGVTFGSEYLDLMDGRWPVEVSSYGTGFDAYVLDGRGAAAIGPLEFYIRSEYDDVGDEPVQYRTAAVAEAAASGSLSSSVVEKSNIVSSRPATHSLLKFNKGTKKSTERQHASVSRATAAAQANIKIANANNLRISSNAIPSEFSIQKTAEATVEAAGEGPSNGSITSEREEYEYDESISINFSLPHTASKNKIERDLSNYKVGIFMRMSNPHGGGLDPVVALPLCSDGGSSTCATSNDQTTGSIRFSQESVEQMMPIGSGWPIDLYQWGTGFDAYVLDESGNDVLGPFQFNIMMNETY